MTAVEAVSNIRQISSLQKAANKSKQLWRETGVSGNTVSSPTPTGFAKLHSRGAPTSPTGIGPDWPQKSRQEQRRIIVKTLRQAVNEGEAYARYMEKREEEGGVEEEARLGSVISACREVVMVRDAAGEWIRLESGDSMLKPQEGFTSISEEVRKRLGLPVEPDDNIIYRPEPGGVSGAVLLPRVWLEVSVKGNILHTLGVVGGTFPLVVGGDVLGLLFKKGYVFGTGSICR